MIDQPCSESRKSFSAVVLVLALIAANALVPGEELSKVEFPGDAARKAKMSPAELAWEKLLEESLGRFYLPRYKEAKRKGRVTAWDYVKDAPRLPRILLIGDSISRGYTMPVRRILEGKVNVHRAPENCGKTSNGLRKLDTWLGNGRWDLIHFNFGIHDRKLNPEDYADRLEMIVERLKPATDRLVFAMSTPIAKEDEMYIPGSSARSNKIARKIMKRHGIPINDLHALMLPRLKEYQNPRDCHFTLKGYEVIGRQVADVISRQLKEPPTHSTARPAATKGERLIFSDDFNRKPLGEGWRLVRGKAAIRDNALHIEGPAGLNIKPDGDATRLGRDLRVEYDATSDNPIDMSLLLNVSNGGDANNQFCVSGGYFFGVASGLKQAFRILAFGEELARADAPKIEPGRTHHVTVEKRDSSMRILVDGTEVLEVDKQRLVGAGSLGFYVWNSASFDNLKVYALPPGTSEKRQ
ncbi:MAG: hypothetical protein QF473_03330 [Planctomycetota bacterium]|jgi:lysophospholipase L1-like esterase|nr:hypothetical protein [Planctomycetota bacterium]